jgi:hypothetical protein
MKKSSVSSSGARSGELEEDDSDGASLPILAAGLDRAMIAIVGVEGRVERVEDKIAEIEGLFVYESLPINGQGVDLLRTSLRPSV